MSTKVSEWINRLVDFAEAKGLTYPIDRPYMINRLMEVLRLSAPEETVQPPEEIPETATVYLEKLADAAAERGIIGESLESRDLFSAKLMGVLTPSPAEIREKFARFYAVSPKAATGWFYRLCRDCNYIQVDRIAKNVRYFADTPCGKLEVTINLSKPEKDPRDIAAQRAMPQTGYPKCQLCVENSGYAGRIGFPARQNHRIVPVTLAGAQWFFQYSPYSYYPEHCIVLNAEHVPMRVSHDTFVRMFDFVGQFPHYFIGSNADLPIVGGSILSHDHFQGGRYRFPMDDAEDRFRLSCPVQGVSAAVIDWPMSCVRLTGTDQNALTEAADRILDAWRNYSDPSRQIFAFSDGAPHNTITPILRREGDKWILNLVLRNNLTTKEHPLGLYHPHEELHHIKKENIGLIEVMGLMILPARLVNELDGIRLYLTGEISLDAVPEEGSPLRQHYPWIREIAAKVGASLTPDAAKDVLRAELALKCAQVLSDAGVYKDDEGIARFLETAGFVRL